MHRKPRLVGGFKGHNMNDNTLPGSPALWAGSFTRIWKSQNIGAGISFSDDKMIIDCHTHIFPDKIAPKVLKMNEEELGLKPYGAGTQVGLGARQTESF